MRGTNRDTKTEGKNIMKNTSNQNLTAAYLKHKEESDQIVHEIQETFANNKTYHDGLSEAQTMIGERELTIARLELENRGLRNELFLSLNTKRG